MTDDPKIYSDNDLLYSAEVRCRCGCGVAYPLDASEAMKLQAWSCAKLLRGEAAPGEEHDVFHFVCTKIREETSINNSVGETTRPTGTVCRTVGYALCPKCKWRWKSRPYNANGLPHHWVSGPCPECGYEVGGGVSYKSSDGDPIEHRYQHVVLTS